MDTLPVIPQANTLLATIEEKLSKLKNIESKPYQTNCKFRFNPNYTGNAAIDIAKITEIEDLIVIDAYLRTKHEEYTKSAEQTFSLTEFPVFTWQDYTYSAWQNDLKQRFTLITMNVNKQDLLETKSLVEAELTKEDRLSLLAKKLGL